MMGPRQEAQAARVRLSTSSRWIERSMVQVEGGSKWSVNGVPLWMLDVTFPSTFGRTIRMETRGRDFSKWNSLLMACRSHLVKYSTHRRDWQND